MDLRISRLNSLLCKTRRMLNDTLLGGAVTDFLPFRWENAPGSLLRLSPNNGMPRCLISSNIACIHGRTISQFKKQLRVIVLRTNRKKFLNLCGLENVVICFFSAFFSPALVVVCISTIFIWAFPLNEVSLLNTGPPRKLSICGESGAHPSNFLKTEF